MRKLRLGVSKWLLLVVISYILLFPVFKSYYTDNLLEAPISISPPGRIEAHVYVPLREAYRLDFNFVKTQNNIIKYIIGGGDSAPGFQPFPLEMELYSLPAMKPVFNGKIRSLNRLADETVNGRTQLVLDIRSIDLTPGKYRVVVKSSSDRKLPAGTVARLDIHGGGFDAGLPREEVDFLTAVNPDGLFAFDAVFETKYPGGHHLTLGLTGDESKLRATIGGGEPMGRESAGAPIPVKLEIYSGKDNRLVAGREILADNTHTRGSTVRREIDHGIRLEPGAYKVVIQVTKAVPGFRRFETTVTMGLEDRGAGPWQLRVCFWGGILYPLAVVAMVLLLLVHAYGRLQRRKLNI